TRRHFQEIRDRAHDTRELARRVLGKQRAYTRSVPFPLALETCQRFPGGLPRSQRDAHAREHPSLLNSALLEARSPPLELVQLRCQQRQLRPGLQMRRHESMAVGCELARLSLRSPHLVVEPFDASLELCASLAQLPARPRQVGPRAGHADLIDT